MYIDLLDLNTCMSVELPVLLSINSVIIWFLSNFRVYMDLINLKQSLFEFFIVFEIGKYKKM